MVDGDVDGQRVIVELGLDLITRNNKALVALKLLNKVLNCCQVCSRVGAIDYQCRYRNCLEGLLGVVLSELVFAHRREPVAPQSPIGERVMPHPV